VNALDPAGPAFALGFALGAAPGPVQLLILSETARRGLVGGLRVMLGANGTLLVVLVGLAIGFSSLAPGEGLLRGLRLVGGAFLVYLGIEELRSLRSETDAPDEPQSVRSLGPAARGIVSVVLNPGAWIFFATTASAVVADATADAGRDAALVAAAAMTVGVSLSDLAFTVLASGGRALAGARRVRWIRGVLSIALAGIGMAFVLQGLQVL
jgi:threonine/homoserine/homoserine lactone efflux protein